MKRYFSLLLLALWYTIAAAAAATAPLGEKLKSLEGISDMQRLQTELFSEKYVFFVEQPLDHQHPEAGSFRQRVVVSHVGFDRPTVLVTEGYRGDYALNSGYQEELSRLFNANMVFVEHRYFSASTPKPVHWEYLTAENSAYDLHAVTTAMKQFYSGKWISTGISKGGQTTLIYRTFFPEDVDISVPYVAPVCNSTEDGRHEPFLQKIGSKKVRQKVYDLQLELLRRKNELMPLLKAYCDKNKLTFRVPVEEIFDYAVLEYSFAFWQWGYSYRLIPANGAEAEQLFQHWMTVSNPSYFAQGQPDLPFFVQAARELGYYGYDTAPFKPYLSIKSSKNYLKRILLPEGMEIQFRPQLSLMIRDFLQKNDPKIIFVYGEDDPWTAAGIVQNNKKRNRIIAIQPKGSHLTRIETLPSKTKTKVLSRITEWLSE